MSVQSGTRKGAFEVLSYAWEYQAYAHALKKHSESLKAKLLDVQREADDACSKHRQIKEQVINWLDDANKELKTSETLLGSLFPSTSCWNLTSDCNFKRRYAMAGKAESHSNNIKKLMERCSFEGGVFLEEIKPPTPRPLTPTTPRGYISVASREKCLERIMEAFLGGDKRVIGLYGVAGVGKKTLVTNLAAAIESGGVFNGVYIITGDDLNLISSAMIVMMANRIGLTLTKDSADKEGLLSSKLLNMGKVLIIVYDLTKSQDLKKMGIPWPDSKNECRILVVSKSLDVCKEMKTQTNVEIEPLCQEEALHLFDGIVKENNPTDTRLIQQARDGILSKYMWTPRDVVQLIPTSRNKLLLPAKSMYVNNTLLLGAEALEFYAFSLPIPIYWRWLSPCSSTPRFKVAELIAHWRPYLSAKVREEWLSPATNYGAYLIYQLSPRARGFNNSQMEMSVGSNSKTCCIDPSMAASKTMEGGGAVPKRRMDGWLEMELGSFFNLGHSGAVVDLVVKAVDVCDLTKCGLLVQGFEIRLLD